MASLRAHPLAMLGIAFLTAMCSGEATDRSSGASTERDAAPDSRADPKLDIQRECSEQDVSRCVAPPSQCRDTTTMRYFTNPTCRAGLCAWEEQYYSCSPCQNGGCLATTTAGGVGGGPVYDAANGDVSDAPNGDVSDAANGDSATEPECTAEDVSRCAFPQSECVSGTVVRYYVNPVCTNNRCVWETREYSCSCINGGCLGTTTTGGAGP